MSHGDRTDLRERAADFLAAVYRDDLVRFPFSTLYEGGAYPSRYDHPLAVRYTLITALGVHRAAAGGLAHPLTERAPELVQRVADVHGPQLRSEADAGLLLLALAEAGVRPTEQAELVARIRRAAEAGRARGLTMQDLSWMLWGAVEAARGGVPGAGDAAAAVQRLVAAGFTSRHSALPLHSPARARRRLVSFGSLTYFLRCQLEWARWAGDEQAAGRFGTALATTLGLQGRAGEWPWLLDTRTAAVLDAYPVFSVHQLSMAMLFLRPAAAEGHPGAEEAVERSFRWVRGENDLRVPIVVDSGRFIYRSIEETDRWARAQRYARTTRRALLRRADAWGTRRRVRLNPESRSYEWGWLLYAWADGVAMPPVVGS